MKQWLFSLLFALPLAATVNEPLSCELFSGYRNDRIHWHLQMPGDGGALTYRELCRDVQFWENGLKLQTIYRDLTFYLTGSYSAFGRGTLFQRYANQSFSTQDPRFQFSTSGWAADTSGYFGYAVNLTADRTYKVILAPLIGFSAHFERLNRKNPSPNPLQSSNAVGGDLFTMSSSLPNQQHLTWYGFLLGGFFSIQPGGPLTFQTGYTYHWLHLRFSSDVQNRVNLFTNGNLTSDQITAFSVKTKGGGNLGHTAWAQMEYLVATAWKVGLGAQVHYFSSQVMNATQKQKLTSVVPSSAPVTSTFQRKYKLRWTSISGWAQVSYEF